TTSITTSTPSSTLSSPSSRRRAERALPTAAPHPDPLPVALGPLWPVQHTWMAEAVGERGIVRHIRIAPAYARRACASHARRTHKYSSGEAHRMRSVIVALIATICPTLSTPLPASAQSEKRVALVIGNSAYEKVGKLPNPRRDAEAMGA